MSYVQGSPSSRKKIIPDGNVHLHKEIKNTANDKYVGEYKKNLCLFLKPFWRKIKLLKEK